MNLPITDDTICNVIETQIAKYDVAQERLATIQHRLSTEGWSGEVQAQLQELVQGLKDEAYRSEIQRWKQQNQSASALLKQLFERMKISLQNVLSQLNFVENTARKLKDELVPRMDLAARERQAANAYGRVARNNGEPLGS